jgi:protein-S-isoprenylcysteine O-methyltransferase Ste14
LSDISQSGTRSNQSGADAWARIARRIRVPVGFAFAAVYVWLATPTKVSLIVGTLVMLPGLLLRGVASGYVQKNQQLTTGGPYAYTRNPLYLGSLMLGAGFAIAARSWWILGLMLFMFAAIYVPVIGGEERFLRQTFPVYDDYARHVPRLWPRFTAYGSRQSEYSSARYWKHREYRASLGCLAVLAILLFKLIFRPVW